MSAVPVIPLDELADGEARRIDVDGVRLCIARVGDRVFAIGDRCTHADVSLGDGEIDEDEFTIECPKHGSEFSLETGEALSLPAVKATPTYPVAIVDGIVSVDLAAGADTAVEIGGRTNR
jgi:3-phenylpropionate/trans-cinnamate dioxygenase ferredoxin subunit